MTDKPDRFFRNDNDSDNSDESDECDEITESVDALNIDEEIASSTESSNEKLSKIITITSFGFSNGRPRISKGDIVISVKNMFVVAKVIRDKYDGTSPELQHALLDIEANQTRFGEILDEIIGYIQECLDTDDDDELGIFIGSETGKHRSVAVVCLLEQQLNKKIVIGENIDFELKIDHRDLVGDSTRQNKKSMNRQRQKNRDMKSGRTFDGDW